MALGIVDIGVYLPDQIEEPEVVLESLGLGKGELQLLRKYHRLNGVPVTPRVSIWILLSFARLDSLLTDNLCLPLTLCSMPILHMYKHQGIIGPCNGL